MCQIIPFNRPRLSKVGISIEIVWENRMHVLILMGPKEYGKLVNMNAIIFLHCTRKIILS